jgi:glutathione S-transferase
VTLLDRVVSLALKLQQRQRARQLARMKAQLDKAAAANRAARTRIAAAMDRIDERLQDPPR